MSGIVISGKYRELKPDEFEAMARRLDKAWCNPDLPGRQYSLVVREELERFRHGQSNRTYDALLDGMAQLDGSRNSLTTLLDVGAASGYYREILHRSGFPMAYVGCDYSPYFKQFAKMLYPDITFTVQDARELTFEDDSFDIVLTSACLSHVREYENVIAEAVRVARHYVIFHRVPILRKAKTACFVKESYGVPCLEIHFNESEFLELMRQYGLKHRLTTECFFDAQNQYGHFSYFMGKSELFHHPV